MLRNMFCGFVLLSLALAGCTTSVSQDRQSSNFAPIGVEQLHNEIFVTPIAALDAIIAGTDDGSSYLIETEIPQKYRGARPQTINEATGQKVWTKMTPGTPISPELQKAQLEALGFYMTYIKGYRDAPGSQRAALEALVKEYERQIELWQI